VVVTTIDIQPAIQTQHIVVDFKLLTPKQIGNETFIVNGIALNPVAPFEF